MHQYFLKKDSKELHAFPHVIEFALKKPAIFSGFITWLMAALTGW
jgi:hypothetical protein